VSGAARDEARAARAGVFYGLAAYGAWGVFPLYFKLIRAASPAEILAHRTIWSFVLLFAIVAFRGRLGAIRPALSRPRDLARAAATTALIATNWFVYIWAVNNDHVLEASLGYFVNPLVNVLLGMVILRERLRRLQTASVLVAAAGVFWLAWAVGRAPIIPLALALSFGLYGLLRKQARIGGAEGLLVETALLSPFAVGYLLFLGAQGRLTFLHATGGFDLLLMSSGVVTALPLIWFVEAARRLRLTTLGFLQYLSPTLQFLLGVFLFAEPFPPERRIAFGLIWAALALFTVDATLALRRAEQFPPKPAER